MACQLEPQTNMWRQARIVRSLVFTLYLAGSIPWDFMTSTAAGLLRTSMSSFAASIDVELTLMPPVNVT